MADETDLDADLLPLEIGNAVYARPAHDHIVAVAVVIDDDHDAPGAGGAGHQGIAVGHGNGVQLARGKGIHGGDVVEPLELHVHARLFKPALLDSDLPGDPARPVAVADLQGLGPGGQYQRGEAKDKSEEKF